MKQSKTDSKKIVFAGYSAEELASFPVEVEEDGQAYIVLPEVVLLPTKEQTMETKLVYCDICEEPMPTSSSGTICPDCTIPCQDPKCYVCQNLDSYIESHPEAQQTWKEILDRSFPA